MLRWIKDELPHPQSISEPCNDYYLIKPKGFKPEMAMYLEDEKGNIGWYTSYLSKVVVEVEGWLDVN